MLRSPEQVLLPPIACRICGRDAYLTVLVSPHGGSDRLDHYCGTACAAFDGNSTFTTLPVTGVISDALEHAA